ncbi:MAG TPA: transcriptional repressor [Planctomycetota bacterium]|nr:transcriptional repressor [Planctomycetota bacterium]
MDAARAVALTDARLRAALRRAGLRVTGPRVRVYAALRGLGGHRSADEVFAAARAGGASLSRMTAYNALADLLGAGLVTRADAGPGRTLFETRIDGHHHFVCRRCGVVLDVPCVRGRPPCLRLPAPVGRADEAQVIFRGVCRACGGRRHRPLSP